MASSKDACRERLTSVEFISLFKEVSTRPEIYFLLMRSVYLALLEIWLSLRNAIHKSYYKMHDSVE